MSRVYLGNWDSRVTERDLEDEFCVFGVIRSVWVARRPLGYVVTVLNDHRDAQDAIRELDCKNCWRVELSHNSRGDGGSRDRSSGSSDLKCYGVVDPGCCIHVKKQMRNKNKSSGVCFIAQVKGGEFQIYDQKRFQKVGDMLGKVGLLNKACQFIKGSSPEELVLAVLTAILVACKLHKDFDLGVEVTQHLLPLELENCSHYGLLPYINAFRKNRY